MPPPNRPMNLMQTLVDGAEFSLVKIPTTKVQEPDITEDTFAVFDHARPIGISPGLSSAGKLLALAIADDKHCTIVEFNVQATPRYGRDRGGGNNNKTPLPRNLDNLQQKILCRPAGDLFAFDMGPLAMSLYVEAKLRITNAVDIQSGLSAVDRKPLIAIKEILGTSASVQEKNVSTVFGDPVYDPDNRKAATDLAMRAWISQLLAEYGNGAETLAKVPRIDTEKLSTQMIDMIAKNANDRLRQDQSKPTRTTHQATVISNNSGETVVQSATFKNKVRTGATLRMAVQGRGGTSGYIVPGQVGRMSGKSAPLVADRSLNDKTVTTVISIGRDDPTTAEAQRAATILRILQGFDKLLTDSVWIQNIFFPGDNSSEGLLWPISWSDSNESIPSIIPANPPPVLLQLNPSQQDAVNTMYSTLDEHRITIIQGPPGTGKTSVIASFVQFAIQTGYDGIWLVAQSNVAVKNIAEKLLSAGFTDWKLLVSKDFIFEWHEHIYTKVAHNIIRSSEFFKMNPLAIKGCKVMLCTLSMLSNMHIRKFTTQNPIKTLIVDEASQIEIGNYVPLFVTFSTLRKACFIGDDKQCTLFLSSPLQLITNPPILFSASIWTRRPTRPPKYL
ncbi:P-loop containing nucleoside triphosphate hydrolase protein [Lyophyllum atratum]|nr:P-loop containing nucleoside triphosphate hydrolase protein [Lyophyllum atratum]